MSDVTGPISSLPGSGHALPDGTMCDYHSDRPAVARIQGETDSFGCEMNDLCADCIKDMRSEGPHIARCDWCKTPDVKVGPRRDMDEGMYGPVYYVCKPCRDKDEARINEELARYDSEFDFGDYDD